MNEQVRDMAPPEEGATRHRQVRRYRRGRPVNPAHEATVVVHPAVAESTARAPFTRPSFRSVRTWVTVLSALIVLLGTAVTTGYIVMREDPAYGSPERVTPVRPAPTPARVGPPIFVPSRESPATPTR